ncbi:MAG: peptide ABC transporter substrate-binding protein [Clostridia bacterium]|nr:peptide ABC transporter substrate-binding protein [Clostridia bacterium]
MKRFVALCLCAAMAVLSLASCAFDPDDRGAIIPIYLTEAEANLDPSAVIYDKDVFKYTTLLFEGLTVVGEDGSVKAGLAEKWTTDFNEERGEYFIEFTLRDTHWSDGRALLADHFVYAWKRLLSPAVASDAACLLFDIKNASKVKSGEMTVDSLGVSAPNRFTLRVELEKKIDIDLFLETVASPALVPLRYDVVSDFADTWATSTENFLSCGPFSLSAMFEDEYMLDKSSNYLISLDPKVQENPNTYVKPAKLYIDYTTSNTNNWNALVNKELHYLDVTSVPKGAEELAKKIKRDDLLSTATLFLNNENTLLADRDVRRAMSLVLDRNSLASALGFGAVPATGFVSNGVFDKSNGSSFRKTGGDLISTTADVNAAKELVKGKDLSVEIKLQYRAQYEDFAALLKEAWEILGLKVRLVPASDKVYKNVLKAQEFDILLLDFQGLTTSAYSYLMPFATAYSGNYIDVDGAFTNPHMTGFDNAAYNELADRVHAATTKSERVAILHEMESMLIDEMPIIPLAFWQNCYLVSGELKNLTFTGFGTANFKDATIGDYLKKNAAWIEKREELEASQEEEETAE